MPEPTVAAIIEKDGKILLTKRNIEPYKGSWVLPGGHIDLDETTEAAVVREVKEETGLDIRPEFLFYQDMITPETRPQDEGHDVVLVFHTMAQGTVMINEESTEFRWLAPQDALKMKLAFRCNETVERWLDSRA
jgi:8-oxo-dGTP diphosphatase